MPKPDLLNLTKKARTQFTKTLIEKLEVNFGNHAKPKSDIVDKTNFCKPKPRRKTLKPILKTMQSQKMTLP
ncbi:MAG: hypothetical protein IPM31_17505 [Anaerolineae bacterium]|nr:hypothetical protein [Anaerolineae bacterium]MBL8107368.1 hypothetical protein [Anaerolineales bacterium]MCC7187134.1 hypothetical protein [Anaerolineales bacterium]